MAQTFERTTTVEDERVPGKTLEEDARGVAVRLDKIPGATTADIGFGKDALVRLREGDNLESMIAAVDATRGETASEIEAIYAQFEDVDTEVKEKRKLTPEVEHETLANLEARFYSADHRNLHLGVKWDRVLAVLKANPEGIWSINKMQAEGHDPDVYCADSEGFDIGTCSSESPASGRNCVYNQSAALRLKESRPDEVFNGSADEMAEAMGISLMDHLKYENDLQTKGDFDLRSLSWVLAPYELVKIGNGYEGGHYQGSDSADVCQEDACDHSEGKGWRGSIRFNWR